MRLGTSGSRLERWLGPQQVEQISASMRDWYGPPIPVMGVPGRVYAYGGGDFRGLIDGGALGGQSLDGFVEQEAGRWRRAFSRWSRAQQLQANVFGSLSDIIAARSQGKGRTYNIQKAGTTGVVGATNSLWRVGAQPAAGAAAAAAPGGTVPTDATTGAYPFTNPTGGDQQQLVRADVSASVAGNSLLLYDRLFAVAKTMNSTATEAVTGVPTRYQSVTSTDQDYAGGNFLFIECGTVLAATAHNWTVCTYTDQDGNAGATLPSVVGNSGNIVNRLDMPVNSWFCPLAPGDTGIKALTQMQCSALVATGAIDFVIGHPLAIMPVGNANQYYIVDMINSAFGLDRVFDDAALAFLELNKPATTATTWNATILSVAG